ncbi:hypothetical protein BaRGS_00035365, partial [Batillaria attramentaria]
SEDNSGGRIASVMETDFPVDEPTYTNSGAGDESYYQNSEDLKGQHRHIAFGGSDDDYAKIKKNAEIAVADSAFETSFDPFQTDKPNGAPGTASMPFGMLQPTKAWGDSAGKEVAADAGKQAVPEDVNSDTTGALETDPYERVWFAEPAKDVQPGLVRPQSELMAFAPTPQEVSANKPVPCEPVYGERSGEYIGLDPTGASPNPSTTFTFNDDTSHTTESSTDASLEAAPPSAVFKNLDTPSFNPLPDDPFKYSGFDTECQKFNTSGQEAAGGADNSSIYEIDGGGDFVAEWPETGGNETESDNFYHQIGADGGHSIEDDKVVHLNQVPPPPPRTGPRRGPPARPAPQLVRRESPSPRPNIYSFAQNRCEDQGRKLLALVADELILFFSKADEKCFLQDVVPKYRYLEGRVWEEGMLGESTRSGVSVDGSDSSEDALFDPIDGHGGSSGSTGTLRASGQSGPISIPRKNERYGYLYKQGGVKANRGWRLRWVVFNGTDLRYYDSNRSQISKKIIPLASMKEVISDIREGDTNRFKFRLVTTLRNRTFLFAADTRDDCCTWTNTLMAAILKNQTTGAALSETESRKPDKEGFIRFENNRQYYVAIWGKTLCYYDSFDDFQMNCPVHEIDMKLSSVKDKKKNKLQLSTHYAHFSLVFESPQEAQSWRMAIEDAIAEGLADDSVLEKVYENDSNRICADCEDVGIHRMFDTSVSKIRSLRMDTRVWTPSLIELMKEIGNGNANLFWERDLMPCQKPSRDSLPEERKQFAQLKYQQRHYSNKHPQAGNKRQLNEALLAVASTSNLLELMQIIFSGADYVKVILTDNDVVVDFSQLSYTGGPHKENAYQTAKRHGQRLLMELLYQNGGDCTSTEEDPEHEGRLREDVRLQGYLLKTGPVGRKEHHGVRRRARIGQMIRNARFRPTLPLTAFDQRWCVLEHGNLTYYLNEKSTTAKDSIDRKNILCLQEVTTDRPESVFEISTSKGNNRVYTFAAESESERGMWMRTLGKLISPVAVMEHVGMMEFGLAALVYMRESVSEDWRSTWVMLSWRMLYYMNKRSGTSLLDQQLTQDNVPVIVERCLTQIYSRGQREEGIYRKSATQSRVVKLLQELRTDAHAVRLDECNIHEVASALKRFFRELEDSLFTRERYTEWIRTAQIQEHQNKFLWYRYLLEKLPLVNYSTLRRIILHIWKLAQMEAETKMNIEKLCTCFAPTLMCVETDT